MKYWIITLLVCMFALTTIAEQAHIVSADHAATLYKTAMFNAGKDFDAYWKNGKGPKTIEVTTTVVDGVTKTKIRSYRKRIPSAVKSHGKYKRGCRYVWYIDKGDVQVMIIRLKSGDM